MMPNITQKNYSAAIALPILLLSGVLTALPLVVSELWFVSWVSMIPMVYLTLTAAPRVTKKGKTSLKFLYLYGLTFSFGYYIVLFYWFVFLYPLDFVGFSNGMSVLTIAVAWVGMTLLQSSTTALVPAALRLLCRDRAPMHMPLVAACLWTLLEWSQTLTWAGVPWGRLALSQYTNIRMIQSASLLGSLFIGFLIVAVNSLFALVIIRIANNFKSRGRREAKSVKDGSNPLSEDNLQEKTFEQKFLKGVWGGLFPKSHPHRNSIILPLTLALIIAPLNYAFGTITCAAYREDGDLVRVALIQGNIASGDKWADNSLGHAVDTYITLAENAAAEYSPDIILMPETVIPTYLRYDMAIYEFVDLAKRTDALVIVGTYDMEKREDSDEYDLYNTLLFFEPDGTLSKTRYYKRHPVPFGEYLPMEDVIRVLLPMLANLNAFESNLTAGESTNVYEGEIGSIGGLICFDSIYEDLTVESVRDGAQLIALATNDSWYRDSAAVFQHNAHAVMRAVENGRYVIRAANTGISSIISPVGEVVSYLEPMTKGCVYGDVYMRDTTTVYTQVGDVIVPFAAVVCAIFAVWNLVEWVLKRRGV